MVVLVGCVIFFILSLFCAKTIGTEFFPAQDNARIAVQLELPIGTRKEVAQEVSQKLTNQWLQKYKGVMKICNYTVGQADSDNTWASMQDNGSHIISFNISLVDPADRDVTLETVCEEMREDLIPNSVRHRLFSAVVIRVCRPRHPPISRYMATVWRKPTALPPA